MHNLSFLNRITVCGPFSPQQSAATTTTVPTIGTEDGSGILGDFVLLASSR
jgi:hypothetical protein